MLEAAVLERMVGVESPVVWTVVAVPVVIVDVRQSIHMAGHVVFGFGSRVRIVSSWRRGRNAALISARRILPALPAMLPAALCENGIGHEQCQCHREN